MRHVVIYIVGMLTYVTWINCMLYHTFPRTFFFGDLPISSVLHIADKMTRVQGG